MRTAPPTRLLCWCARYSSRCTPSRCRQRRSSVRWSTPASHPATCSARAGCRTFPPSEAIRPFSSVLRKRGARRPIISPPLGAAAPGSARHLPERTRPLLRTISEDSRQLARSEKHSFPRARDPIRTLLPPWLTCGSRGKENLQRSNMGAAFCVLHSDTSSCGRTGMRQASSHCASSMQY